MINCPGVERKRQEADDKKISHCLVTGLDCPSDTLSASWVNRSFCLSNSLLCLRVLTIKSLHHFLLRDRTGCFVQGPQEEPGWAGRSGFSTPLLPRPQGSRSPQPMGERREGPGVYHAMLRAESSAPFGHVNSAISILHDVGD